MCIARRNLTPKARRLLVIGNLCLVAGLILSIFDKDLGEHHATLFHSVRGFLIGLSIALNFGALRMSRNDCLPQP